MVENKAEKKTAVDRVKCSPTFSFGTRQNHEIPSHIQTKPLQLNRIAQTHTLDVDWEIWRSLSLPLFQYPDHVTDFDQIWLMRFFSECCLGIFFVRITVTPHFA